MTKSKEGLAKDQAKSATETARAGALNTGLAAPSTAQVQKARDEGVTEAIRENAKDAYNYATDGQLPGEPTPRRFTFSDAHTNFVSPLLTLGADELAAAIDPTKDGALSDDQVANLLALERAGPNRTEQVRLLCKRLGVSKPTEVTNAGPGWTNNTTSITAL